MSIRKSITTEERIVINEGLDAGSAIASIAKALHRSESEVIREIRAYCIQEDFFLGKRTDRAYIRRLRKNCSRLQQAPYCCNGCPERTLCNKSQIAYRWLRAEDEVRYCQNKIE